MNHKMLAVCDAIHNICTIYILTYIFSLYLLTNAYTFPQYNVEL